MTRNILLSILAFAIAAGRILGLKHESFQAAAHLFVGGLAGAWLERRDRFYAWVFAILCVVEVACFVHDRFF